MLLGGQSVVAHMENANREASPQRAHRHVMERVAAFLDVPQQASARGASKALCEAMRAVAMEALLRGAVLEHCPADADTQLVLLLVSRLSALPFPSDDALVAWSGGLAQLYEELQLRFPFVAAVGISERLATIRPFPFASGSTMLSTCIVTAIASTPLAHTIESVVLGQLRNTNVLVPVLCHDGAPCPILCLEGTTSAQLLRVPLSGLLSTRSIPPSMFQACRSLRLLSLTNLPMLESIGDSAFTDCVQLSSVDLSNLPSLRSIGNCAFNNCESVQFISLVNLPMLECVGEWAFSVSNDGRVNLSTMCVSCGFPSLRSIGKCAFSNSESSQFVSLTYLPRLENIGDLACLGCVQLSSTDLSNFPSLHSIGSWAFNKSQSLQSISHATVPMLESVGDNAFSECAHLSSVDLSNLPFLRSIGKCAFNK